MFKCPANECQDSISFLRLLSKVTVELETTTKDHSQILLGFGHFNSWSRYIRSQSVFNRLDFAFAPLHYFDFVWVKLKFAFPSTQPMIPYQLENEINSLQNPLSRTLWCHQMSTTFELYSLPNLILPHFRHEYAAKLVN